MPTKYTVSLKFSKLTAEALGPFALNTVTKMTGNAAFPTPRVPLADITAAANTLIADVAAARGGGTEATAKKNASFLALDLKLRDQAAYVQSIAGTDLEMLLSSGFEAVSTNRARIVLPQVVFKSVNPIQSGVFKIAVNPVPTAKGYELRYKNGTGDYINGGIFTNSREVLLQGLIPGNTYTLQVRAIGGLTNYSDWSAEYTRMAI
jgi:hypothetical protein